MSVPDALRRSFYNLSLKKDQLPARHVHSGWMQEKITETVFTSNSMQLVLYPWSKSSDSFRTMLFIKLLKSSEALSDVLCTKGCCQFQNRCVVVKTLNCCESSIYLFGLLSGLFNIKNCIKYNIGWVSVKPLNCCE